MALSFGWSPGESRVTYWPGDPCFVDLPDDVVDTWRESLDGEVLMPYAKNGKPTEITVRVLTHREIMRARALTARGIEGDTVEAMFDAYAFLFRVGVDFDLPATFTDGSGAVHKRHVTDGGIRMLTDEFTLAIDRAYPGIVMALGGHLMRANMLTGAEKKASSPPSTEAPSSVTGTAAVNTESQG